MKILVIGSGGREHALCWKISQSEHCTQLFCAPGNPGTSQFGKNIAIPVENVSELLKFAKEESIDLTVVGPELPLALGLVDEFEAAGLVVFGPNKAGAELEGSKSFTKDVLVKAGVPTARYQLLTSLEQARQDLKSWQLPLVIKADGLAAGKGVVICNSAAEVEDGLNYVFNKLKSDKIVCEEFLAGVEASFIVATDGQEVVALAPSHDYKRIFDSDQGPNTGGMGTVCPTPRMTEEQGRWTVENVIRPTLAELKNRGITYKGFMYAGLMISAQGQINVIEYNARLGDPETQVIMRRMKSDIVPLLARLAGHKDFKNADLSCSWSAETALCVVLASAGYPESSRNGDVISGIEFANSKSGTIVFHAGTKLSDKGELQTAGGRVLNVTNVGATLEEARSNTYAAVDLIQFAGVQARRDIGKS